MLTLIYCFRSQTQSGVVVRWDIGLNQKRMAFFHLPKLELGAVRLVIGDELILTYRGELHANWEGKGHVVKIPDSKQRKLFVSH